MPIKIAVAFAMMMLCACGLASDNTITIKDLIAVFESRENGIKSGRYDMSDTTRLLVDPKTVLTPIMPGGKFESQVFYFKGSKKRSEETSWDKDRSKPRNNGWWVFNGTETRSLDKIQNTGLIRQGEGDAWDSVQNWFVLSAGPLGTARRNTMSQYLRGLELNTSPTLVRQVTPSGDLLVMDLETLVVKFDTKHDFFPVEQAIYKDRQKGYAIEETKCEDLKRYSGFYFPTRITTTMHAEMKSSGAWIPARVDTYEFTNVAINSPAITENLFNVKYDDNTYYRNVATGEIHWPKEETKSRQPQIGLYSVIAVGVVVGLYMLIRRRT